MELQERLKQINLYLIGMMGAGKSTVGEALAARLGYRFLDTDTTIEQLMGQSIPQIFATLGESAFRDIESQVLAEVAAYRRMAIATGGGIVLRQQNWSYLHHGIVIWLDVPVEVLYARLQGNTTRPLLQDANPQQRLRDLLGDRQRLYAQADIRVQVSADETPDQLVDRILEAIASTIKPDVTPAQPPIQPDDVDLTHFLPNHHATDA
jgi:shikimate kinase